MTRLSVLFLVGALVCAPACKKSSGGGTPTAPSSTQATTPPATATRVMTLIGSLAFGDVVEKESKDLTFTIRNDGNSALTVTGISVSSSISSSVSSNWTSGTIPASGSQDVRIRFTPQAVQTYSGQLTIAADHTTGSNTVAFSGRGIGPAGSFTGGTRRVGSDIQAGRYFAVPTGSCYWERVSGFGGTFAEIIANDFIGTGTFQAIVDVLSSDAGFVPDSGCGLWRTSPTQGAQTTIRPGTWLVGAQVPAGTYGATPTRTGCYWERLRNFEGRLAGIIANDFIDSTGPVVVTIAPSDTGFTTDTDCGTWTRLDGTSSMSTERAKPPSEDEIRRNRDADRARWPRR